MITVDSNRIAAKSEELRDNLKYYDALGKPVVEEYSRDLDDKVTAVKQYLDRVRELNLDFDVASLQRMLVDLSTTIYYTNDKLEKLGLLEDLSGIKYKDKYNESYLAKQGNATVADKKFTVEQLRAYADQEALEERLINFIYSHAAKTLNAKIDSANELLKAVSKILSSKITEMQTTQYSNRYTT